MTSLILGLLLAAPPSPAPPTPRMEKLTRILAGEDRRDFTADVRLGLFHATPAPPRPAPPPARRIRQPPRAAAARRGPAWRGASAVSIGGRRLGRPGAWRAPPSAPCSWPVSPRPIHSPVPPGRAAWAR